MEIRDQSEVLRTLEKKKEQSWFTRKGMGYSVNMLCISVTDNTLIFVALLTDRQL